VLDLSGYVLLPGFSEPYTHLDKAFTAGLLPPGDGTLAGAISTWLTLRGTLLGLRDGALQAERSVVELARVIEPVPVADQRGAQRADFPRRVAVAVVASELGCA
jgi:hypothetical protein